MLKVRNASFIVLMVAWLVVARQPTSASALTCYSVGPHDCETARSTVGNTCCPPQEQHPGIGWCENDLSDTCSSWNGNWNVVYSYCDWGDCEVIGNTFYCYDWYIHCSDIEFRSGQS